MANLFAVAVGGSLGAVLRYALTVWTARLGTGSFPFGTWFVNVLGCLAIGALSAWFEAAPELSARLRLFLLTGLLGAFTTFSTFGLEVVVLAREGLAAQAFGYIAASLVIGLAAVLVGRAATDWYLAAG